LLVEAGLSRDNPDIILKGRPHNQNYNSSMYYDHKVWARNKDLDGRLPIVTAVAKSLKWTFTRRIFVLNMPAVYEMDVLTGLPLFMLAAIGPMSDMESVYNILKESLPAVSMMINQEFNCYTGDKRKRTKH